MGRYTFDINVIRDSLILVSSLTPLKTGERDVFLLDMSYVPSSWFAFS